MSTIFDVPVPAIPARIRQGLPVVAQVLAFWFAYVGVLTATGAIRPPLPPRWRALVVALLSAAGVLAATLFFLSLDRRPPASVGLGLEPGSVGRFVVGALAGLALFSVTIGVMAALAGPVHFVPGRGGVRILAASATYLAMASMEELGFRGYPLRTLHASLGFWPAQGIVAVAFLLTHVAFGWSWANALNGILPGALLFGMVASASRGLAMPIGLHAAWNLASWSIGARGPRPILVEEGAGHRAATVGRVSGIAVLLLATAGAWSWYRARELQDRSVDAPGAAWPEFRRRRSRYWLPGL